MDYTKIAQLAHLAAEGDQAAFGELYELLFQSSYYSARKVLKSEDDAADVVQDVMVALYHKLPSLENPQALVAYINRMIYGKSVDLLRKQKRWDYAEDLSISEGEETDEDFLPESYLETKERRRMVQQAVDSLSDGMRVIILMYYFQQMSTAEICDTLSLTETTVNTRLSRARSTLKGRLMEHKEGATAFALGFIFAEEAAACASGSAMEGIWAGVCNALDFPIIALSAGEAVGAAAESGASSATAAAEPATQATLKTSRKILRTVAAVAAGAALIAGTAMLAQSEPQSTTEAPPTLTNELPPEEPEMPPEPPVEPESGTSEPIQSLPEETPNEAQSPAQSDGDEMLAPEENENLLIDDDVEPADTGGEKPVSEPDTAEETPEPPKPEEPQVPQEPEEPDVVQSASIVVQSSDVTEVANEYRLYWNDRLVLNKAAAEDWDAVVTAIGAYLENRLGTPLSSPVIINELTLPTEPGSYSFTLTAQYIISGQEEETDLTIVFDIVA